MYPKCSLHSALFLIYSPNFLYSLHFPEGYPVDGNWDDLGIEYLVLWSVTSLIRTMYTFLWDINRDWGLFRTMKSDRTCLHREILYRPMCLYYLAIGADFILRLSQTIKISLGVFLHVKSDLLFTSLAVLEVIRRFMWNFFRLELQRETSQMLSSDHICNTCTNAYNFVENVKFHLYSYFAITPSPIPGGSTELAFGNQQDTFCCKSQILPSTHMMHIIIHNNILLYVHSNIVALDLAVNTEVISHSISGHHGLSSVSIKPYNTDTDACTISQMCY